MFTQKDYAQREKIKFTVYGLQFKNTETENQEPKTANGLNYSKLRRLIEGELLEGD